MPTGTATEETVKSLHQLHASLLACWNRREADGFFAALFTQEGNIVGFDERLSTELTPFGNTCTRSFPAIGPQPLSRWSARCGRSAPAPRYSARSRGWFHPVSRG